MDFWILPTFMIRRPDGENLSRSHAVSGPLRTEPEVIFRSRYHIELARGLARRAIGVLEIIEGDLQAIAAGPIDGKEGLQVDPKR